MDVWEGEPMVGVVPGCRSHTRAPITRGRGMHLYLRLRYCFTAAENPCHNSHIVRYTAIHFQYTEMTGVEFSYPLPVNIDMLIQESEMSNLGIVLVSSQAFEPKNSASATS